VDFLISVIEEEVVNKIEKLSSAPAFLTPDLVLAGSYIYGSEQGWYRNVLMRGYSP